MATHSNCSVTEMAIFWQGFSRKYYSYARWHRDNGSPATEVEYWTSLAQWSATMQREALFALIGDRRK